MKHYHYIFTGGGGRFNVTVYKWLNLGSLRKKLFLLDENQKKLMIVLGVSGK
jgi:hypothetical protein